MAFSSKNYTNYGATNMDTEVIVQPSSSGEINSICADVYSSIETINNCIRYFTTVGEQIGTQKDSHGLRDQILVRIMSSNQMVKTSQKDISRLGVLARGASKTQKLQIQRLTGNFKDIVERNYQTQQAVLDKLRNNALWSQEKMMESSGDQTSLLQADQIQMKKDLEFEQEMLLERQERIKQIESQILDANELMKELSALINDQGTMVDSIERQIENVNVNVQEGHSELNQAADYAARARKKKLFLLGILAMVLIVLIGIIAWSLSS